MLKGIEPPGGAMGISVKIGPDRDTGNGSQKFSVNAGQY
jgi:hypothetical protein